MSEWRVVADGFAFAEGLRWHDGELWLSDIFAGEVLRVGADGEREVVARVAGRPSGLGWRPDGSLLVSSMRDQRVLRLECGTLTTVAELSGLIVGDCNDLLVDSVGRAYVGNFGYDYAAGHPRAATSLVLVDTDGTARLVADDLWFPNGMAVSPDGAQLFVAETPAERISVFSIAPDGSLGERWLIDRLAGLRPDGISFDAAGRLWVASPGTGQLGCLAPHGTLLHVEDAPGGMVQTCVVGGADDATLFVCATPTHDENDALRRRAGRILARVID